MWIVRIYKIELDNFIMFSYKIPHYVSSYIYSYIKLYEQDAITYARFEK